jgi:hypothetical protein
MTRRIRNGLYVWRALGPKTFFRLVLYRLGLTHTHPCPPDHASDYRPSAHGPITAPELLRERFLSCHPLDVFTVPASQPDARRLSIITDSINTGSLYGGVGTAMLLGALLAEELECRLRVVTRTERARPDNLHHVLDLYGVSVSREVEFAFAPAFDSRGGIDILPHEQFLTTSWWTTAAALGSVPSDTIVYLLQEDERTFYPYGDDRVRCEATLSNGDIRFVVNTRLLFDHLVATGLANLSEKGVWFEPAFPREVFHPRSRDGGRRTLVFYARPHHPRNLFYLGVDVLDHALTHGVIDTDVWDVVLVGKDVPELVFSNGYEPRRLQNLQWADYADLAGRTDLALSLMSSVHPSYPPLDFAASGAVVVTNRWEAKEDLSRYSDNILCADLERAAMVEALGQGVRLAEDDVLRRRNHTANGISTDWKLSLREVVATLAAPR